MPKYLALIHRTLEGRKTIKDAVTRLSASTEMAAKYGCKLEQFYMTIGEYDQIAIFDAPDDIAAARYKLAVEAVGAIQISDLRLFTVEEYREIISGL